MWFCKWIVLFVLFSIFGWIYETAYCTIKTGEWANRGFLYGPMCPIYGAGSVGIILVHDLIKSRTGSCAFWLVFVIGVVGSFVLEYFTHWILEKIFHACWWDYSYMPLNIKGRVCLPYSLAFGVAALVVVYGIGPFAFMITSWITPGGYEVIGVLLSCLIGMDIALTVSALSDFEDYVADKEKNINKRMDQLVLQVKDGISEKKDQISGIPEQVSEKLGKERDVSYRERISESLSESMHHMNEFSRAAVSRIYSFRPKKNRGEESLRTRMFTAVKKVFIWKRTEKNS